MIKIICNQVDFAVKTDHRVKMKRPLSEGEKIIEKFVDTVIKITKNLLNKVVKLEI